MRNPDFVKVGAATAAEICRSYAPEPEAAALLDPADTPRAFLDLLRAHGLATEAVRFLANALPKREAVWWGCLAARHRLGSAPAPEAAAAVSAAEAWVYQTSEENRRAAMDGASAAGLDGPAGWAAMAAFWSGGSIAPPDLPEVPAAAGMTAAAVASAVVLAAAEDPAGEVDAALARFLDQGMDIAGGGNGRAMQAGGESKEPPPSIGQV